MRNIRKYIRGTNFSRRSSRGSGFKDSSRDIGRLIVEIINDAKAENDDLLSFWWLVKSVRHQICPTVCIYSFWAFWYTPNPMKPSTIIQNEILTKKQIRFMISPISLLDSKREFPFAPNIDWALVREPGFLLCSQLVVGDWAIFFMYRDQKFPELVILFVDNWPDYWSIIDQIFCRYVSICFFMKTYIPKLSLIHEGLFENCSNWSQHLFANNGRCCSRNCAGTFVEQRLASFRKMMVDKFLIFRSATIVFFETCGCTRSRKNIKKLLRHWFPMSRLMEATNRA